MQLPKIENLGLIGIMSLVIIIFSYFLLGFSGAMAVFGIMLLFVLPMYLILDNFNLEQEEKIVFSFFLGIGIFPAMAYWLGMVISFKVAILVAFLALTSIGLFVRKYWK